MGLRTALSAELASHTYDAAHETPSIRVSPKDGYPCEAHYNGKLPMDSVPIDRKLFSCAHSTAAEAIVSQSDSLSSPRPSPPLDITFLVPRNGNTSACTAAQREGGLPAGDCYNQGHVR